MDTLKKTDKQTMKQIYTDLLNTKFKVHGRTKEEGFDCYGLVIEVLRRNGIKLKDVFYKDFKKNADVHDVGHSLNNLKRIEQAEENCIIEISVNGNPTHIGVYIGNGMMIHCTRNMGVVIEPIRRYSKRIVGYYKVSNS